MQILSLIPAFIVGILLVVLEALADASPFGTFVTRFEIPIVALLLKEHQRYVEQFG